MFLLVISLGFIFTLFSWWPWAEVAFEVPKVFVFSIFVKVLFLLFVFDLYKNPKNLQGWKLNKKLSITLLIFLIWVNITSLIGSDPIKSYLGNFYRRDGLITLFDLASFAFLISYFWKESYNRIFSGIIFAGGLVLGAWSLILFANNRLSLGSAATFGNPVFLAGFLAVSLPMSLYFISTFKNSGNYRYTLLIPQTFSIFFMGATSAVLTAGLWFLLLAWFKLNKFRLAVITFVGLAMMLAAGLWVSNYIDQNSKSLIAEGRIRIYANLWEGILKRPLTGYGWSNVDYAFKEGNWPLKLNDDVYVDKAHSHLIEVLTTTGVLGLLLYLSIIVRLIINLSNKYKSQKDPWSFTVLATFILFLFHSQTNVISITEEMLFWFVVGLVL